MFCTSTEQDGILSAAAKRISFRQACYGCLFHCAVQVFFVVLYVSELGFYKDDWSFLAIARASSDQSPYGLFKFVYTAMPWAQVRPVQLVYLSTLYWNFGLNPLGYHITNALVWMTAIVLFYLVIRELSGPRLLALVVPLAYSVLPNYSTDRFWYLAFQANLSMALYFLSSLADLKAIQPNEAPRRFLWGMVALISLLASGLSYEMVFPLFGLNSIIIWQKAPRSVSKARTAAKYLVASQAVSAAAAVVFKYFNTERVTEHRGLFGQLLQRHYYLNLKTGVQVHFGSYGVALPLKIFRILRDYRDLWILLAGIMVGITVFFIFSAIQPLHDFCARTVQPV